MTKHTKRYTGDECDLMCGSLVAYHSDHRSINWSIGGCWICGMFVETVGYSPQTDRVLELEAN